MNKSVLVINTPKYCALCVLRSGVLHPFCRVNNRDITDLSIRPDWCPLKPLPEEKEKEYWRSKLSLAWIRGWNTCISKIKRGEVDGEINKENRR